MAEQVCVIRHGAMGHLLPQIVFISIKFGAEQQVFLA